MAKRKYKAVAVELTRRLANKWSANASYTWSRFEGNFDLDYSGGAVFNTSSFIHDGPGTFVGDPYRYGPLRQDRPHVFKLFASWLPIEPLTVGVYYRMQSGTPWAARGQDTQGGSALNYLEQAGTHRNPNWSNVDLLTSYRLKLAGRATVAIEARVLNLIGNQTQLSTDSVQYPDAGRLQRSRDSGRGQHHAESVLRDGQRLRAAATAVRDGEADLLAACSARRRRVGARFGSPPPALTGSGRWPPADCEPGGSRASSEARPAPGGVHQPGVRLLPAARRD